jgi:hypothetical protein
VSKPPVCLQEKKVIIQSQVFPRSVDVSANIMPIFQISGRTSIEFIYVTIVASVNRPLEAGGETGTAAGSCGNLLSETDPLELVRIPIRPEFEICLHTLGWEQVEERTTTVQYTVEQPGPDVP